MVYTEKAVVPLNVFVVDDIQKGSEQVMRPSRHSIIDALSPTTSNSFPRLP
jgi:hypothetical protein